MTFFWSSHIPFVWHIHITWWLALAAPQTLSGFLWKVPTYLHLFTPTFIMLQCVGLGTADYFTYYGVACISVAMTGLSPMCDSRGLKKRKKKKKNKANCVDPTLSCHSDTPI